LKTDDRQTDSIHLPLNFIAGVIENR